MSKIKDTLDQEDAERMYELELLREEPLSDKEWRDALDRYLSKGDMDSETYERMDDGEKRIIQELKKAKARIKNKQK